jgi:hypothetical protein
MAAIVRAPRGQHFKDRHCQEFGLQKINDSTSPASVRCNFCYHFGREEKVGAKRRQSTNIKCFESGSFQPLNYRQHLNGAHPIKWALYQALEDDFEVRKAFWVGDADNPAAQVAKMARIHTSNSSPHDKKRSPHKSRGLGANQVKIDKLTETYLSGLQALKAEASMSNDPEVYDDGKKILNLIMHVEEGRVKHGI